MDNSIQSYFNEFLRHMTAEKDASPATITSYQTDIKVFTEFLRGSSIGVDIKTLTAPMAHRYVNYLKIDKRYSNSTVRRKIHSLSSFYKYLLEMEYIDKNPLISIHAPKNQQKLPIYLTQADLEKLLKAPEQYARFSEHILRDKALMYLLIFTGARKSEIIALNWCDVNFKAQNIKFLKCKGKKERIVPLLPKLAFALLAYYNERKPAMNEPILLSDKGMRISTSNFQCLFHRYIKKCGLDNKGYTPHKCRHSLASLMLQNGASLITIQQILGHSDLNSTKIYTHTSTEYLNTEMQKFPL